ncbi:hypothetical protein [Mannheimia pernigra]|uniref:hypothetical protein n=1 Tax=Mannheimia pernigra TaxID=111844 RepID=UPI00159F54E4|nr:hypothetical protein [Mannheimia pernigra]QLB44692.1 hypothetical protein HV561_08020 [Mannheimia pernigra]
MQNCRDFKSQTVRFRFVVKKHKRRLRAKTKIYRVRQQRLKLTLLKKRFIRQQIPCVDAPEVLSLSLTKTGRKPTQVEHTAFVEFKDKLYQVANEVIFSGKHRMAISFAHTTSLYAEACILLIATIDSLKHQYPKLKFDVIRPNKRLHNHKPQKEKYQQFNVDAVFCHVGLYKLLGKNYQTSVIHPNVQSWHYVFSDDANGDVTNPIFDKMEKIGLLNLSKLYRGVIEGIANAVEHAYDPRIKQIHSFPVKRWWMLVAKINNKLQLFICDLGHGIPNTLQFNKEPGLLDRLRQLVKGLGSSDCYDIQAATLLKETRTKLLYRGKGGEDLKSFIKNTPNSSINIYSNRGFYRYNSSREILYDNKLSIKGTLLHWSIKLNSE